MVQEPELEEGETFYYNDDDATTNPDIALSYIGDKVQSILGHLQKDFEGGVSAENLGAKFGGYGSFLPTHQRSASIWLQPKSPTRFQNAYLPRSPSACPEGPTPKSITPSSQRDDAPSSPSVRASQTLKTSSRQKETLSSGKVAETFQGKLELPSSKLGNPLDQRMLKVRIKVGPERVTRYNAQTHSLGITSQYSSEGNSHDDSDELLHETCETPNESPAYMLKTMTSFPISDGFLLSPLCEELLNLTREREFKLETKCEAAPKNAAISIKFLNNDALGGKKTKAVDNRLKDNLEGFDGCEQQTLRGDNMECNTPPFHDLKCKSLPYRVKNSDKNALINKRRGSKNGEKGRAVSGDPFKDFSFEHTSLEKIGEHMAMISQKDVSVDHGQLGNSGGKGSYPPFRAYSEGERVENAMDGSTLKTSLRFTCSEHNESNPRPLGNLPVEGGKKPKECQSSGKKSLKSDSFTDGDCAVPKKKSSGRKDARPCLKDAVQMSVEHMENPKHLSKRASVDLPKNFNLDDVKAKPALVEKLKERLSNKKFIDRVLSYSRMVEPPAVAIPPKEENFTGFEQTVVDPVLIKEEWVCCDHCETWRLLPYGTNPDQLPDKWVCSMLDWLPGYNRCDISENETTAALHALYKVPVPQNQHHFQAHANGTVASAVTTTAYDFNQKHQNFASYLTEKQKLQKRQSAVATGYPLHSNSQMQTPLSDLENGGTKDVKPSLSRGKFSNQIEMKHPSKSAFVSAKLNKRKGEHVAGADSNPMKKIKQESGEYLRGKEHIKRTKSKDAPTLDNDPDCCGKLGVNGHGVTLSLPSKALKNAKKKNSKKEVISAGAGNIQINMNREKVMQDLPHNGPVVEEMCNGRQVTANKIKLKDNVYSQNNGNTFQERKFSTNESSNDGDFHRDKKPRVSHNEGDEFRGSRAGDILKRRCVESGAKEYPTNRSIEKRQQVKKLISKTRLTIEDIDELRKDLGCEQLSMAATSSSSKISDSRKNRLSCFEVKGSPEDSVSSSPRRMLYQNQVSPMMTEAAGKVNFNNVGAVSSGKKQEMNNSSEFRRRKSGLAMDNGLKIVDSKNKTNKEMAVDGSHHAPKHEVSSNTRNLISNDFSLKSAKNSPVVGKNSIRKLKDRSSEKQSIQRERDKNDLESNDVMQESLKQDPPRRIEQSSSLTKPWSGKVRIDLRQGDKQGVVRPSKHASGLMGSVKSQKVATNENVVAEQQSLPLDASLRNKNFSSAIASTALKDAEDVLKEAEELRTHADLIKNSGFSCESNYEYFKAALKFLHGALLLEACDAEPSKQMETSPMQVYGAAAQLCKICASEYEKGHELASAALAYKCMEVAYLKVVYCKSSSASKFCQDLQSSLQMVPQGESPSSSASDVDSLNNLAMTDKAAMSKGSGSPAANHVILLRNRPNFVRLLDFTKDVNSAMEAAKKSQDAFAAAHVELKKSQKKEAIVSIKRVIDFSFEGVEELVRLVMLAFNSINQQGLRGDRE